MKLKKILMISLVLNAGLLAGVGYLGKQTPEHGHVTGAQSSWPIRIELAPEQTNQGGIHFGKEFEVALADTGDYMRPQLLDLESGRSLRQPTFDQFGRNGRAAVAWLTASGLDLARVTTDEGQPVCVAYYMATEPVPEESWDLMRAEDILTSDKLRAKKRFCIEQKDEPQVFIFKTQEGSRGILRIERAVPDSRLTRIRYRLVAGNQIEQSAELAGILK